MQRSIERITFSGEPASGRLVRTGGDAGTKQRGTYHQWTSRPLNSSRCRTWRSGRPGQEGVQRRPPEPENRTGPGNRTFLRLSPSRKTSPMRRSFSPSPYMNAVSQTVQPFIRRERRCQRRRVGVRREGSARYRWPCGASPLMSRRRVRHRTRSCLHGRGIMEVSGRKGRTARGKPRPTHAAQAWDRDGLVCVKLNGLGHGARVSACMCERERERERARERRGRRELEMNRGGGVWRLVRCGAQACSECERGARMRHEARATPSPETRCEQYCTVERSN